MLLFVYCCVIFFLTEYFWYFEMQLLYALLIQALCKDILHSPLTAKLKIPLKAQKVMWFFFFLMFRKWLSLLQCVFACMGLKTFKWWLSLRYTLDLFLPFYQDITVSVWIFEQLLPILWYMYAVSWSINTWVVPLAEIEWDRYLSNYSTSPTSSASTAPGEAHTSLSLAEQGITAHPLQSCKFIVFKETM